MNRTDTPVTGAARRAREPFTPQTRNSREVEWSAAAVAGWYTPDHRVDPLLAVAREQTVATVDALLAQLPEREAEVLRLHFGIGEEPLPLWAIADRLRLSPGRVRSLEQRALRHLRVRRTPLWERAIALLVPEV